MVAVKARNHTLRPLAYRAAARYGSRCESGDKDADATCNPGEPKTCTQQGTTCKESESTCVSDHGIEQNHDKSKCCGPDKRIDSAKKMKLNKAKSCLGERYADNETKRNETKRNETI